MSKDVFLADSVDWPDISNFYADILFFSLWVVKLKNQGGLSAGPERAQGRNGDRREERSEERSGASRARRSIPAWFLNFITYCEKK